MKRSRLLPAACMATLALLVAVPFEMTAQQAPPDVLRIRRLESTMVRSPIYTVTPSTRATRTLQWLEVRAQYETRPEWIDEMTFTYYILLRNRRPQPGENPLSLFRGDVTYVNVASGRHESTVYLHPTTVQRFGEPERVALVVSSQGRPIGMESNPSSQERWWEQLPPRTGVVLNRTQSPFALVDIDNYEAIKPAEAR